MGPGGPAAGPGCQEALRRCSQRKRSDLLLLGCASLLASLGLGQDLLQTGRLQVPEPGSSAPTQTTQHQRNINTNNTTSTQATRAGST